MVIIVAALILKGGNVISIIHILITVMNSNISNTELNFTSVILESLSAMHEVSAEKKSENLTELFKDGFKFGEVVNNQLRLLNKNGNYTLVEDETLSNKDQLLRDATYSYWVATGQK